MTVSSSTKCPLTAVDVFPPGTGPVPGSVHEGYVNARLEEVGRWGDLPFASHVRRHAQEQPDKIAYTDGTLAMTWAELDSAVDLYASLLVDLGLEVGDRVGVVYPDGPVVHALYLATERAGLVSVGIGPRAGFKEVEHLLKLTGATAFVTGFQHLDENAAVFFDRLKPSCGELRHHIVIDPSTARLAAIDGVEVPEERVRNLIPVDPARALSIGEIFLINSTSGTTGMPKCVVHNQNRWIYYFHEVLKTAPLTGDDVFLGLVPAPYGFGIWTAHAIPILLGATTVVQPKYSTDEAVRLIEEYGATVMAAVTTQFIKMLHSEAMENTDTSSLKVMYTGGEAIPYQRAVEFEERTGAAILNFYGSNETGMLSYTKVSDPEDLRRRTGGQIVPALDVHLFGPMGEPVEGQAGRSACAGPATSLGYWADDEANEELFTSDGYMLTGDLCTIDDEGYLRVVGRTSSFIIRGGKNISEAAVEEAVASHPSVAIAAAVGVPDPIYGERVRAVVELHSGHDLTLEELKKFLGDREVSKELWPEQLEIVEKIPLSSGGKVAKGDLRRRLKEESGEER